MAWDIDGYEALSAIAAVIMGALAILILRSHLHRAQNRWLVSLLVMEFVLAAASPSIGVTTDRNNAYWASVVFLTAMSFVVPVYLGFLSTLGTSISRLLRKPMVRIFAWALPATAAIALVYDRSMLVAQPDPTAQDPWATVGGPLFHIYQALTLLTYVVGLVTALLYWRSSPPGTSMRRQGAAFALAFGLHDGIMTASIVTLALGTAMENVALSSVAYYGFPVSKLVFVSLVTYGILRVQLFDIDLKIKWTLGRGTALTLLTGAFFLITETIEFFLPGEGLFANLAGAAIVAALARPAWRLGTRFANTLLPGVVETEEFRQRRRVEVYRASLESVAADGIITERERRILETMRAKLGISPVEAARIETEVLRIGAQMPHAAAAPGPA